MNVKYRYFLVALFLLNSAISQNKDAVLLNVAGEEIKTSEFLRVYNKNLDLVKDESQKDVDGYLKLFTEYQLKLKEARRLKLNEDAKYQREFLRYKKQLTKNYLSENKVTDALVKEAYERSNLDINASHILVRLDENANDTINAYNEVLELRSRVLKEGYDVVKEDVHNGSSIFLEDLGYFSAFKMVYDFETAAYNTPKGKMSMPFRTQFGYHVVKINDRRESRGTVTAAHIMIALSQNDSLLDAEERIKSLYKKLQQGESFESLAKQFSDDKSSAKNGGKLSPFKSGQLSSTVFEDEAFALNENGETSQPFKTEYGWHIVKRIDYQPMQSFEELKPSLEAKVKRDTRSKLINAAMVKELEKRYQISYNPKAKAYFESILSKEFFARSWKLPEDLEKEKNVFTINNRAFTYIEFGRHLMSAQRIYANKPASFANVIAKEYKRFFEKSILQYREDNLELENEDFANIIKEYRDGLLLFDLMEKEVWNKASTDTIGLKKYYETNKSKYVWGDRVNVTIASSGDNGNAKRILKMMKKGKSEELIKSELNQEKKQNVIFTKGLFNVNDSKLPVNFEVKKGLSKIYQHNEAFHVINIIDILPAGLKTLDEAKGNVINDYQAEIESNWMNELKARFKVVINESALKAIKKKINKQ
ncbi:peptidylprolyl isomerase [Winogradskyella sp. PE311]|uniref:peptidylprolyl isomerase n=1 Tax=Winogradskyella sp. PE311 TaxID=3366943 RepID=UPI003980BA16